MSHATHYALLGVPSSATPEQIRVAYRAAIRAAHPDRARSEAERIERTERAAALNAAYAVLRDPVARFDYDRALAAPASTTAASPAPAPAPSPSTASMPEPSATARSAPPADGLDRIVSFIVNRALGQYLALALVIAVAVLSAPLFAVAGHEAGHVGSIVVGWLLIGAFLAGRRSPAGDLAALAVALLSPIVGGMTTSRSAQ